MTAFDHDSPDETQAGPGRRLRMEDLAAIAGVSKITVSRALRDSDLVRPEVRAKIKALAQQHGYRLNSMARALRLMRSHTIALVVEMDPSHERSMADPMILGVLGGLLQVLTSAGYRVVLTTHRQIEDAPQQDADGIILLGQGRGDETMERLRTFDAPLVIWGAHEGEMEGAVFVGSDNFDGGRQSGERLVAAGRKRIVYLGDRAHPEVAARIDGLAAALDGRAALTVLPCDFNPGSGRDALAAAIAAGTDFDAVAACSDFVAMGALEALQAAGLDTPGQVSVIGFDDSPAAATARVPLTTIRQDWNGAGEILAGKMLAWLNDGQPSPARIPVELIVRESA